MAVACKLNVAHVAAFDAFVGIEYQVTIHIIFRIILYIASNAVVRSFAGFRKDLERTLVLPVPPHNFRACVARRGLGLAAFEALAFAPYVPRL
jgi:hypothetical protein